MGIRRWTIHMHELEARRFSDLDIYARSSSIHATTSQLSSYCRSFSIPRRDIPFVVVRPLCSPPARTVHSMCLALPRRLNQVVPPLVISSLSCVLSAQLPNPISTSVVHRPRSTSHPNLLCRWIFDWPALRFLVSDNTLTAVRSWIEPVTLRTPQIRYFSYLAPVSPLLHPLDTY